MVKVASVYKDLICERPAGLCKDIDVQEYATAQDMMESTCLKVGYAHTLGFYEGRERDVQQPPRNADMREHNAV